MHQRRKLTNIVPYFHIYLNLTNVYIDIKDKLLANITDKSYCKQSIFSFEVVQTIYFGVSSSANNFFSSFSSPPPPLQKNNGSSLNSWLSANKLTLNIKKSNFVLFRPYQKKVISKIDIRTFDNFQNNFVSLENKEYVKYLGLLMDCNLSWSFHINYINNNNNNNKFI